MVVLIFLLICKLLFFSMITRNGTIFILAAMILGATASSKRKKISIPAAIAFSTPLNNSMSSIIAVHQLTYPITPSQSPYCQIMTETFQQL